MQVTARNVVLVGTAHVSEKSVEEVRAAIAEHDPDVVAVELDENRLQAITNKRRFEETPITELLKGGKAFFILAQTLLASFQRRMGAREGVEPGAEMLAAVEETQRAGKELALADRDIGITLKRAWARMSLWEKMKLTWELMKSLVGAGESEEEIAVEDMLEEDVLTLMMEELSETAPSVAEVFVRERDAYLAKRIHDVAADGKKVVAVVGAGHVKGVQKYLEAPESLPESLDEIEEIPKKRVSLAKAFAWALPLAVIAFLTWQLYLGFTSGDFTTFYQYALTWIVCNGVAALAAAILARAHPASVVTAFIASPLTSLNPTLAAGWFAGIVEAKFRTPTVGDFQGVSRLLTFRDFWANRVTRVLLVTALVNLGSMGGSLVGAFLIGRGTPLTFGL